MNGYNMITAIVRRDQDQDYIDFFQRNGAGVVLGSLCEGSARKKLLDMLGLERKEKVMLHCVLPSAQGHTGMVMDAAREAGATGVTIVRA